MTPARYLMKWQPYLRFFGGRSLSSSWSSASSSSSSSAVIPRFNVFYRVEVEEALLDYFHCTRNLDYLDAKHISKNSPHFAKFLFANLEIATPSNREGSVCSEVKKFLRYNPINEYDPFLESSGLSPFEIRRLLSTSSRAMCFFLSDDVGLLENYHVLCNYGIPRSKIGKIYKEASEVFKLERGVLKSKLEGLEKEIGLETSTVVKLVSSCPNLLLSATEKEEFSHVLAKLKEFGFEQKWLRSSLSTTYRYRWGLMRPLLEFFLCQMGCQEDDLKTLIRENPWFLFDQPGKILYTAMTIFLKIGLKRDEILALLLNHPQIVSRQSIPSILLKWVEFLNPEEMASVLASQPCSSLVYLLSKKPECLLATKDNIDAKKLRSMILHDPNELSELLFSSKDTQNLMTVLPSIYRKESTKKTNFLLKLGFSENFNEIEAAQTRFRCSGDLLEVKFNVLLEAGLGFKDCSKIVKECPQIMNQTKENLKTKIDYMVNLGGYSVDTLINFPTYLCYDVKNIRIRLEMFRWIKENGGVKPHHATASLASIVAISTRNFLKHYVNDIPKGIQVWEKLQELSSTT